jgi:putative nucleotidyltransferase with HDIG domain
MNIKQQELPKINEAEKLLLWGNKNNPGPWFEHSKVVARAAKTIALKCNLDENVVYLLGLLHDIGRYEGVTDLHHNYSGYKLIIEKGYVKIAKICLTHSFPNKNINEYNGKNDCTKEETVEIKNVLKNFEYDDYDKLIQLCDTIGSSNGICFMEKRIIDVIKRHKKINKSIIKKWETIFEIKKYFDKICGINIYNLFMEEIINSCI